jgi:RNA methyltransferase, TrmH family
MVRKIRHQPIRSYGRPEAGRSERGRPQREAKKLVHVAGLASVEALFATAPERIERLFFIEAMKGAVGDFCLVLAKAHKTYRLVRGDELDKIAGTAMHGGIVALAEPQSVEAFDPAEAGLWAKAGEPLLVLDGVGNPHNLGAIARTAAFFGLKRLVISDHKEQAAPSDAAYRVARGGLEHVTIYRAAKLADTLKRLRKDYLVLGTALENGKPLSAYRGAARPLAVVLGNEEEGLSRETLAACEGLLTLGGGGAVQSLNVAATAAILIHTLMAQRED